MEFKSAVVAILKEFERAITIYPDFPVDPVHAAAIVAEESGELIKAALELVYESKGNYDTLATEAIQTAAMALRFLVHLDTFECHSSDLISTFNHIKESA